MKKLLLLKKHFFGYLRISDSTGKGLLDALTELQLELSDCRGQSYDNSANMKGKHSGVQARMLDINPKAVYVPCANHTLNLVVAHSANSSTEALTFFGVLTRLYVLFSFSAQRWEILKKHVEEEFFYMRTAIFHILYLTYDVFYCSSPLCCYIIGIFSTGVIYL